jgi:Tfp pilus assembly protein PilV
LRLGCDHQFENKERILYYIEDRKQHKTGTVLKKRSERQMDKNIKIAGVSIIEILIAMFLVAIALFTIATLFPTMGAHRKGIHESEQAKLIAMEVLEGLQMWSAIAADTNATPDCNGNSFNGLLGDDLNYWNIFMAEWDGSSAAKNIGAATYTTSWIFICSQPPTTPFNTAKVTVTWNKSGKTHNIDVTGVLR